MAGFLDRLDERAANMGRMMRRLGVEADAGGSVGAALRIGQAAHKCSFCTHTEACTRWLAAPDAAPDAYHSFCINAGLFDTLAA